MAWSASAFAHAQNQGDRVLRVDSWSQNFLQEQATARAVAWLENVVAPNASRSPAGRHPDVFDSA